MTENRVRASAICGWLAALAVVATVIGAIIETSRKDFHLSGTQVLDVTSEVILTSHECYGCHGPIDGKTDPLSTWIGGLMAHAGRDPLFYAQLATANQDAAEVGSLCLRCHVPMSFVTGNAYDSSGQSLNDVDRDGVTCHFCHSMVDPIYKQDVSPEEDFRILENLERIPKQYGNAMFVLDPEGTRRGPYADAKPLHTWLYSPFHLTGEFCGTCHEVGNVAVSRRPDGTYRYNNLDEPVPDEDPRAQFPLERTYSEWKLSQFAQGGVDMAGRYGGSSDRLISTCQDCHMPPAAGQACNFGPVRSNLAKHDFAGASAWVLETIGLLYRNDQDVYRDALQRGIRNAVSMLRRAATLEAEVQGEVLTVRVTNETGHKLPTGHIEGRRVFINVRYYGARGHLVGEFGRYDRGTARLDEESTEVFEMHIGLSKEAAAVTGLPAGRTTHMVLADVIVKDNRIPPRGFNNEAFAAAGAPVVGADYADGEYWADVDYPIPPEAATAKVTLYYQTVTRDYIEALRDGNHTNDWGAVLYQLWKLTDNGPPIRMATTVVPVNGFAGRVERFDDPEEKDRYPEAADEGG